MINNNDGGVSMITNITLSTKERLLLQDAKEDEEQCIRKYNNYANLAADPELKAVFRSNCKIEEEHLQKINELLSGKVPSMSGGQSGGQTNSQGQTTSSASPAAGAQHTISTQNGNTVSYQASDKDMCTEMLMTEKYVSGVYDTAIFEFRNAQVRDLLNHIQKEEQKHGEAIFAYMQSKGMYSVS
jgi:spore coat protein CotF